MPKYSFDLNCNGERRKLVMTRSVEESEHHLAMKLMAYLMYFEQQPMVEFSVGQHYKPDLVCCSDGYVDLWIDCGDIGIHKLDRVTTTNHRARIVVVKPTQRSAISYKRLADRRLRRPERVGYVWFDNEFLDALVESLSTRNELVAEIDRDRTLIEIEVNGAMLRSRLNRA